MNRNYNLPAHMSLYAKWSDSRETSEEVAAAIAVVADLSGRDMDDVWEAPTQSERDNVEMCLNEWARHGDIEADTYHWGVERIVVAES